MTTQRPTGSGCCSQTAYQWVPFTYTVQELGDIIIDVGQRYFSLVKIDRFSIAKNRQLSGFCTFFCAARLLVHFDKLLWNIPRIIGIIVCFQASG